MNNAEKVSRGNWKAVEWVRRLDGDVSLKCLLFALATHIDKNLTAYPSISLLALECGMSESSVKRTIKKAESLGLLSHTRRRDATKQMSNLYTFNIGSGKAWKRTQPAVQAKGSCRSELDPQLTPQGIESSRSKLDPQLGVAGGQNKGGLEVRENKSCRSELDPLTNIRELPYNYNLREDKRREEKNCPSIREGKNETIQSGPPVQQENAASEAIQPCPKPEPTAKANDLAGLQDFGKINISPFALSASPLPSASHGLRVKPGQVLAKPSVPYVAPAGAMRKAYEWIKVGLVGTKYPNEMARENAELLLYVRIEAEYNPAWANGPPGDARAWIEGKGWLSPDAIERQKQNSEDARREDQAHWKEVAEREVAMNRAMAADEWTGGN